MKLHLKILKAELTGFIQKVLIAIAILLAIPTVDARAAVQPRPPIAGYGFNIYLFPSGADLGIWFCTTDTYWGGTGSGIAYYFDHVAYSGTPGTDLSVVKVWCKFTPDGPPYSDDTWNYSWRKYCSQGGFDANGLCPAAADKSPPDSCDADESTQVGNPINLIAGEKTQIEHDYSSPLGLEFTRYYTSLNATRINREAQGFFQGWRHTYSKVLSANLAQPSMQLPQQSSYYVNKYTMTSEGWKPKFSQYNLPQLSYVYIARPTGYPVYFSSSNNGNSWQPDSDVNYQLAVSSKDSQGRILSWKLTTPSHDVENYDGYGNLTSIQFLNGYEQEFLYSTSSTPDTVAPAANYLITVNDNFGRSLQFRYDANGRMTEMIDPANKSYRYGFDVSNNLASVTYPDGFHRNYLYNEKPNIPDAISSDEYNYFLTGIVDETSFGVFTRYASYTYDSNGRPVSTEHASGIEKYTLNYDAASISDPLGMLTTFSYVPLNGTNYIATIKKTADGNDIRRSLSYDANGNPVSRTDFNGMVTNYTYDIVRNLELTRTEAAGTAQARTITTVWHPTFRLPIKVAEPQQLTLYTYDDHGNLLMKTRQATTDTDGSQGVSATTSGSPRNWSYAYNSVGQPFVIKGPNIYAAEINKFEYDSHGNLTKLTNPLEQMTTLGDYDANGRVGSMRDPNGLTTTYSYSPRGWMTSKTQGTEVTNFSYDGPGQLLSATFPDGTTLNYTYDAAHRLTKIVDDKSNSVNYTLDAMGNRIEEQFNDPSGALNRQISRVFDARNRLQQITGN